LRLLKEKGVDLNHICYGDKGLLYSQIDYLYRASDIPGEMLKIEALCNLGLDLNITCNRDKHESSQDNVRKFYQAIKELLTKPKEKSFLDFVGEKSSIKPEDIVKQKESREQEFDLNQ
jgi:hypothetical protein